MEKNFEPFISIIVPVYNSELYLDKCIQSIINQSYIKFELILVNDGSKDNSLSILKKYETLDQRIILFDQENKGVSVARNKGIDISKGEFICFVDSDDYIDSNYLSTFVTNYKNRDILIIQKPPMSEVLKECFESGILSLNDEIQQEKLIINNNLLYNGSPFNKFFETSIIKLNNIYFLPNITYGEDLIFFLNYLKFVSKIHYLDYSGYHYSINSDSASSKNHSFETYFEVFNNIENFKNELKIKNKLVTRYIYNLQWDFIQSMIDKSLLNLSLKEKKEKLLIISNALTLKFLLNVDSKKRKILFLSLKAKLFNVVLYLTNNLK